MTDQLDATRASIVAAVQQELTRFSKQVATEVQRLRDEIATERDARTRTDEQLRALAPAIERSQETSAAFHAEVRRTLDEHATIGKRRYDEIETRLGRVADEASVGLAAAVESAAVPLLKQLEHRQDGIDARVDTLGASMRRFDAQASQLVEHVNVVTEATEARMDEVTVQLGVDMDARLTTLASRVDEVSAQAARQQAEVSNALGQRVDQAEDRVNDRILAAEARVNEQLGQRVADIDAHVGRVSVSVDDAVTMLSDRISGADGRFAEITASLAELDRRVGLLDVDAIDELKDRVTGAAGEVELVRIEMDRFKETIGDTVDSTKIRITDLETQLQEQHLDVETAVQLERLEEVERAIIALDPSQFVRRDEALDPADSEVDAHSENGERSSVPSPDASVPSFDPPVDAIH